ncbi:MAG: nitroreductase family protein [Blautia sp.]|nr:nitroreductase family protein [Blautia sp.]
MDAYENIVNRRSIRKYTDQPIGQEDIRKILAAAMCSPSCANTRDWSFLVVQDPETLNRMADANGRPAEPLRRARLGILVLGDLERAFSRAKDYWVVDAAIVAENMCLAANALGIGSVWLGTWPQMERVEAQRRLFNLPETVVPHSILAFGYPDETPEIRGFYEEDRVHFEKW